MRVHSLESIECLARQKLENFNPDILTMPIAFAVEKFVECHEHCNVDYMLLDKTLEILGAYVLADGKIRAYKQGYKMVSAGTIVIDERLQFDEKLLRFVYMHEYGHHIFHADCYVEKSNRKKATFISCQGTHANLSVLEDVEENDRMDFQADYFASAILIPRETVSMALNDACAEIGFAWQGEPFEVNSSDQLNKMMSIIGHLAGVYMAPEEIVTIRLSTLGFLPFDIASQMADNYAAIRRERLNQVGA